MNVVRDFKVVGLWIVLAFGAVACGGTDSGATTVVESPDRSVAGAAAPSNPTESTEVPDTTGATDATDGTDASEPSDGGSGGVILADLCSGGQPLDGAITLDDLVSYGILTSTDATVEGSGAYDALAYDTFGFLCNISEDIGSGENFLTIGMSAGSGTFDLAIEQGEAPIEVMGPWEVIVGSNWLSPLAMRYTDADGNQDSLFATWTPADGSIPDAATLERLMRPLAEAIASRSTVDIPRS